MSPRNPAAEGDATPREQTPRLPSVPLTADGSAIDWQRVRPSSKQKLLEVVARDPVFRPETRSEEVPDAFGGITEDNVAAGLDLIQTANALVFRIAAAKFVKHPILRDKDNRPLPLILDQDLLDRSFRLTAEQHAELDPRATRLAQKYAQDLPPWLKKNLDLYLLVSMFLSYTARNAKLVLEAQIKRDLARAQQAFAHAKAATVGPKADSDAAPSNGKTQPFTASGIELDSTAPAGADEL